jgi:DNA gyrase subunit B
LAANLRIPFAALAGREFLALKRVHARMMELVGRPPFTLRLGNRKAEAASYEELSVQIVELTKEGIQLQRFKGLGEMNPDQLWETTMNPMTRTLMLVSMEDAQAADEVFTMLMGDKVEPRREFIEKNAKEVRFLDV